MGINDFFKKASEQATSAGKQALAAAKEHSQDRKAARDAARAAREFTITAEQHFWAAGTSLRQPALGRIAKKAGGKANPAGQSLTIEVVLEPEPLNKADKSAIKITAFGIHAGYVPKDETWKFHEEYGHLSSWRHTWKGTAEALLKATEDGHWVLKVYA